jgi:ribonuclease HI
MLAIDHDTTSDHSAVTVTLSLPTATAPPVPRRCWRRADWERFNSRIQSAGMDLSQLQGTDDTLRSITNITKLIHQAIDEAVPLRVPRKVAAPWWNHSLTLAKQRVKQADRRARLRPSAANLEDSEEKRSKWSMMVRNAKAAYRVHQLESVSTRTVWKTIKYHNTHHKPVPPLDGRTDFQGKCDALRKALFPDTAQRIPLPPNLLTSKKDLRHYMNNITAYETQLAISHLKYGTSVGPDHITYDTLRRFHEAAPHLLPDLFTACLRYATHPPEWKTANCVIIPKPGKKSYSNPKSYRPISLQSCFGKLLESIVAKRLSHAAWMCGATHPSQMGALPENSAIDALLRTITPIANSISKKITTNRKPTRPAVLTHDIEGAFNQVHPSTLQEIMHQRRMPSYLTNWVAAFNTGRKMAFGFDQQTEQPQPYRCGLPQGSPISPILFLIYSNAMLERQHNPPDAIDTSYVDDVCMVQLSHTIPEANTSLEERTEQHLENGVPLGLTFATSKTELLYCLPLNSRDKNKSLSSHPPLRVLGTTILAERQIKYLGVFIDESLTFKYHASMAAARANKVLGSLNFLRHRSRGIPAYIAHHLAMTAILPAMFWASPAWWTGTPGVVATLKVAYNAVARWITGLPLNTRTTHLITLAHLPPMEIYLDYLSLRYAIRLHFLPAHHALGPPRDEPGTHTNLPGLHRLHNLSRHLVQGKLEDRTATSTTGGVAVTPSPNPNKTTQPQQLHQKWLQARADHTIMIYTDGSKLANGMVGCGWAIYHCGDQQLHRFTEGRCHLGSRAEVFDAELHAVQEAVSTLLTTTLPHSPVFICIDNQAAIDTLHFNKHNHEYARRTLEIIGKLQLLGWQISTVWCPSHCGIRGNERADTLAKLGASSTTACPFALTTKTWLLTQARAEFLQRWKTELPLSRPSFKFPNHLHNIEWADTRALWRVFCNRSPSDTPPNIDAGLCPCGLAPYTSHHLLRDCPLLAVERSTLLTSTIGDIRSPDFLTAPENALALRRFLRATGLGHTAHLHLGGETTTYSTDNSHSDSPEPDFGVFDI